MRSRSQYERQAATARGAGDLAALAHALRHLSDIDRKAGDRRSALSRAEEAVGLYRAIMPLQALDLANALRLEALATDDLNGDAVDAWTEARSLYAAAGATAGVDECDRRLTRA